MAEKTKEENRQDFKAILDAGGPRGAVAKEVVTVMASYFDRCAELNDLDKSLISAFAPARVAAVRAHAEELEEILGRLYAVVRDWEAIQASAAVHVVNVVNGTVEEVPGAEAAR